MKYSTKLMATASLGVLMALPAVPANALDEILVTSRKREESILDVPVAVTAFGRDQIEDIAIKNLDDISNNTPGLTFFSPIGEFLPTPVIRGVAPTAILGTENNVAMFVDGVFFGAREGLNISQIDVERIEVIKGPQSALYGGNSFSGAINIISAKPTDEFQGQVEGTIGSDETYGIKTNISGPIVEGKLGARIALSWDETDGTYDNLNPDGPDNIGGRETFSASGSLLFTPTDRIEILASGYYAEDDFGPTAMSSVSANCENQVGNDNRLVNFCGDVPSIDDEIFITEGATGEERESWRGSLRMDWDLDFGTITALGGYSNVEHSSAVDGSRNGTTLFGYMRPGDSPFSPLELGTFDVEQVQFSPGPDKTEEWSAEIKYSTPIENRIRGSIGAFYYESEFEAGTGNTFASQTPLPDDFVAFSPGFGLTGIPGLIDNIVVFSAGDGAFGPLFEDFPGANPFPIADLANSSIITEEQETWAIFGSAEADINDQFTARIELRYAHDEKTDTNTTVLNGVADPASTLIQNDTWNTLTTRVTVDWDISESLLIYGSIASGSKSGGFDSADVDPDPAVNDVVTKSYDPETNWTYELGAKGTFADGRVGYDVAAYFIDWDDIVIPQIDTSFATLPAFDTNSGRAEVKGIEGSLTASITDNLTATFGAAYTDAVMKDALIESFALFPSFGPDGDMSGQQLLRSPKWQLNGSLAYRQPIANSMDFYARTDISWRDEYFVGLPNQAVIPDFTNVNLRAGFETETWQIELWSENLLDSDDPTAAFRDVYFSNTQPDGSASGIGDFDGFFPWRLSVQHPERRTFGVTGRYRF